MRSNPILYTGVTFGYSNHFPITGVTQMYYPFVYNPGFVQCIITARKRILGQDNNFTGVCLSTGGHRDPPTKTPLDRDPPPPYGKERILLECILVYHILHNPGGVQERAKCLHLNVWGGGILCASENVTPVPIFPFIKVKYTLYWL